MMVSRRRLSPEFARGTLDRRRLTVMGDESDAELSGLHPLDRDLLGLQPQPENPRGLSLEVVPHLCRVDGRFYGGAALAAALAASEFATGRPALWSATQLVGPADLGDRIDIAVDVVASGRSIDQVQVRGTLGDRLVFSAVGSTATEQADGLHGVGAVMPAVVAPDECAPWRSARSMAESLQADNPAPMTIGHHLAMELREAPLLDAGDQPGRMGLWARLGGGFASRRPTMTAAILGFLADMVPLAICRASGAEGAGTSLDNSLRVGHVGDTEWVLLDLAGDAAAGGLGYGHVHLWSADGRLLGTGSQSARLFTIEDFMNRRAR
jgi:acyl-CoA thioesterase